MNKPPIDNIVKSADFIAAGSTLESLPEVEIPEIAFIGRSNVGKSTLINKLCSRKSLARTSSTPGRTQEINLFQTELKAEPSTVMLADLPGFGYAKFSKTKREYLSMLTVKYIEERKDLKVMCLLNDCRRMPERDELALRDLVWDCGRSLLVIATKVDKLKKNSRPKQLKILASAYGLEKEDLLLSEESLKPVFIWNRILPLLEG